MFFFSNNCCFCCKGWAEVTEANVCQLLRSELAVSLRDQHQHIPSDGVVTDASKFSKIIARAVDLVARGPKAREERGNTCIIHKSINYYNNHNI